MLVVLLTAVLLAQSSAQRKSSITVLTSSGPFYPDPVQQTQDSESGPSAADASTGNVQEGESAPLSNEDHSANSGNEWQLEQQESQQAESQEHYESAGKKRGKSTWKGNVEGDKNQHPSFPENPQWSQQQIHSKQKSSASIEEGPGHYRADFPPHSLLLNSGYLDLLEDLLGLRLSTARKEWINLHSFAG
uniref:Uncharacterized protein n=1 Tax=Mus spicilegus TaxID=10103 RepID=A0A8C6I785_MUSSI